MTTNRNLGIDDASVICQQTKQKKNVLALVREEYVEDGMIMIENDAFGAIQAVTKEECILYWRL